MASSKAFTIFLMTFTFFAITRNLSKVLDLTIFVCCSRCVATIPTLTEWRAQITCSEAFAIATDTLGILAVACSFRASLPICGDYLQLSCLLILRWRHCYGYPLLLWLLLDHHVTEMTDILFLVLFRLFHAVLFFGL